MVKGFIKSLKNLSKNKVKVCLFAILFLFTFQMGIPKFSVNAEEKQSDTNITTVKSGDLTLIKQAEQVGANEYKITFKVNGKSPEPPTVDIALMIDVSKSMEDKIDYIKNSINEFCDLFNKENNRIKVNVALGTFSLTSKEEWGVVDPEEVTIFDRYDIFSQKYKGYIHKASNLGDSKDISNGFKSLETIKALINAKDSDSKIVINGGTNTQAGIWRLGEMIKSSDLTHKRYAVLFTDGLPTASSGNNCKGAYDLDKYYTAAENEYKNVVSKFNKFYSAGIFTNLSSSEVIKGKNFLSKIQNVCDGESYKKDYFSESAGSAKQIFKEIGESIIADAESIIAKNSIITDKLDNHFVMPSKENLKVTGISKDKVTVNENGSISFNIGDIVDPGIEISFIVTGKDPYYCGNSIPTNEKATIKYNPFNSTEEIEGEFGIPKVNIEPKTGIISFEKKINDVLDPKDNFTIVMEGNNKKIVENLYGNTKETINVYLRNEDTDISNHPDNEMGFITAGEYTVTEIIPMNYKKVSMEISFDNGLTYKTLGEGEKFIIDYQNPNVSIRVNNEVSNRAYWWDKENIYNVLPYKAAR